MKKILFLILLLCSFPLLADDYKDCYTANWFDVAGEGISLNVISPERVVGQFYSYGTDGRNRWYSLDFNEFGKGVLRSTDNNWELHNLGNVTIDFIDDDTLLFVYFVIVDIDDPPWCLLGSCQGSIVMRRLTQPFDCN